MRTNSLAKKLKHFEGGCYSSSIESPSGDFGIKTAILIAGYSFADLLHENDRPKETRFAFLFHGV